MSNIRLTIIKNGNIISSQDYYPYGEILRSYTTGANVNDKYKYTEKERDIETGYDYFPPGRTYDSKLARWLQVDPLASQRPGLSPYNYCQNNPLNRIDPDGLTDVKIYIKRTTETNKSTIGSLLITNSSNEKTISGYTLELPWRNNQKNISRIKADTYSATRSKSSKFNKANGVIRLENKHNRNDVLIHYGNTSDDTEGCILVGSEQQEDKVNNSVNKLKEIINYIDEIIENDNKNNEETNIDVIVIDPEKTKEGKKEEEKEQEKN